MNESRSTTAREIAQAATAFAQQQTGRVPESVAVVLSEDTLVITLHGALSPAEKALAQSPAGAAEVQEFHRQLFRQFLRFAAAGDQTNHRSGGARSRCRNGNGYRFGRERVRDRYHGASIPARPKPAYGQLE